MHNQVFRIPVTPIIYSCYYVKNNVMDDYLDIFILKSIILYFKSGNIIDNFKIYTTINPRVIILTR